MPSSENSNIIKINSYQSTLFAWADVYGDSDGSDGKRPAPVGKHRPVQQTFMKIHQGDSSVPEYRTLVAPNPRRIASKGTNITPDKSGTRSHVTDGARNSCEIRACKDWAGLKTGLSAPTS